MDYQAFTNESLTMMYESIRGALAADNDLKARGGETRFRVRETPEWITHAAALEKEMLRRGMLFEKVTGRQPAIATLMKSRIVSRTATPVTSDDPPAPTSGGSFCARRFTIRSRCVSGRLWTGSG